MFDKFFTVLTTALAITAVGIALRPKAPTASVITAFFNGFSKIQTAWNISFPSIGRIPFLSNKP